LAVVQGLMAVPDAVSASVLDVLPSWHCLLVGNWWLCHLWGCVCICAAVLVPQCAATTV